MSALPDSDIVVPTIRPSGPSPAQFAAFATASALLGLATIWPTALALWKMWLGEPTKSLGMLIPLASLVLIALTLISVQSSRIALGFCAAAIGYLVVATG